ncbi:MAG TPA: hypothetical protein VEV83_08000 [Parafilimonas sp.]|nr:hypothetical protein [Parafilimonas sp.]
MKIVFNKILLTCFFAAVLIGFFTACEKETDQMIPPILEFKTGAGYTSDTAATVSVSTPIKVGIHAEKTEGEDYLHTFTVSHSYDGALPPVVDSMHVMEESERDIYETDVNFIARDIPGTEVWYFTISNKDGLVVTKTITLTVE